MVEGVLRGAFLSPVLMVCLDGAVGFTFWQRIGNLVTVIGYVTDGTPELRFLRTLASECW
ncbi:MAG: hypothetical protein MUF49_29785 [Oculatellaceae cyanobacterium Prado106]|nr:hypothetical protein [Oculatellaceae cyanobacterium Prado106]